VNILDDSITLLDVLSGWGLRECKKYPELQVPSGQPTILGTEVVLRHVPKLIARIFLSEPLDPAKPRGTFRADFGLEDIDKLILHCGVALTAAPANCFDNEEVRRLVETPDFTPIVCTVQVADDDTDHLVGPFVICDGWHRAAAWLISTREGQPYRLTAKVIKTKRPLVQLT
jgi:hypothetical protein